MDREPNLISDTFKIYQSSHVTLIKTGNVTDKENCPI